MSRADAGVSQFRIEPGSLNAPGLSAPPAVSRGAAGLAELRQSLGLAAGLLDQAAAIKREDERRDKGLRIQHAGQGSARARALFAELRRRVVEGDIDAAPGQERDIAQAVASEYLVDDLPAPHAEGFREAFVPELERLLVDQNLGRRELIQKEKIKATRDFIITAKSADDVKSALADIRSKAPDVGEHDLVAQTLVPALRSAAVSGDPVRFENVVSVLGEMFPDEVASQRVVLDDAIRKRQRLAEADALESFFAGVNEERPASALLEELEELPIGAQTKGELTRMVVGRAQRRVEDQLRTRILAGRVTPEDVEAEVIRRAELGAEDPGFLDPAIGQALVNQTKNQQRFDLDRAQVSYVLAGGGANLTEIQHGKAFASVVGPEGLGFIDTANRIADRQSLGAAILRSRLVPQAVRETLFANLTSSDPEDVGRAAFVVGMVGESSPRLFAKLYESADESLRPALDASVEAFQRGRLQDSSLAGNAVEGIRRAMTAVAEVPTISADAVADLKRRGIDLDERAESLLRGVARSLPYGKDAGMFGLDFLWPDPSYTTTSVNILDQTRRWYVDRFVRVRDRVPPGRAVQLAEEYVRAQVRDKVDVVRWGDRITAVLIDDGQGLRLPDGLRWGEGFEAEARADLTSAGFDADDVYAMRPYLEPSIEPGTDPTASMGWVYIDADGDPLVNDKGELLIFRPGDRTAASAAKFQATLDRKMERFEPRQEVLNRIAAEKMMDYLNTAANPSHPSQGKR